MNRTIAISVVYSLVLLDSFPIFAHEPEVSTQTKKVSGFGEAVMRQMQEMDGEWTILDAKLHGAPLPKDRFQSLRIDSSGFDLHLQSRKTRFEFIAYELEPNVFIARSEPADDGRQLFYEIKLIDGIVKIRYRTSGAHIRPEKSLIDDRLLIQRWKKAPAALAPGDDHKSKVSKHPT
ncbi:MAG: hypothetical protein Aurels2KO_10000 [Aureliella sp.]